MIAAFFDVDKTLIRCNSQEKLVCFFFKRGFFKPSYLFYPFLWKLGHFLQLPLINDVFVREKCYSQLSNMDEKKADLLFKEFYEAIIKKEILLEAQKLVEFHKSMGHKIVLVSASIDKIVAPIARFFSADFSFNTTLEVKDGVVTGKLYGNVISGEEKASVIKQWSFKNGIDLSKSYAYGNSRDDIPMLRCVGSPVAVNPDRGLRYMARKNNWQIELCGT